MAMKGFHLWFSRMMTARNRREEIENDPNRLDFAQVYRLRKIERYCVKRIWRLTHAKIKD